jgi:hypothetical protein
MAHAKRTLLKGVSLLTLLAGAVALAHALKKNKKAKMLKAAADDAKEHVIAHAKKLKNFSKASYAKVVDGVLAEYGNMKTLSKKELDELSGELKAGWQQTAKKLKKS